MDNIYPGVDLLSTRKYSQISRETNYNQATAQLKERIQITLVQASDLDKRKSQTAP